MYFLATAATAQNAKVILIDNNNAFMDKTCMMMSICFRWCTCTHLQSHTNTFTQTQRHTINRSSTTCMHTIHTSTPNVYLNCVTYAQFVFYRFLNFLRGNRTTAMQYRRAHWRRYGKSERVRQCEGEREGGRWCLMRACGSRKTWSLNCC